MLLPTFCRAIVILVGDCRSPIRNNFQIRQRCRITCRSTARSNISSVAMSAIAVSPPTKSNRCSHLVTACRMQTSLGINRRSLHCKAISRHVAFLLRSKTIHHDSAPLSCRRMCADSTTKTNLRDLVRGTSAC